MSWRQVVLSLGVLCLLEVQVARSSPLASPDGVKTTYFSHVSYLRNGELPPVMKFTRHDGEIVTCNFTKLWFLWRADCGWDLTPEEIQNRVVLKHFLRYHKRSPDDDYYSYDYDYEEASPGGSQELGLDEDDLIENSIEEDNGEVDMDSTNGLDEDDLNENLIDEDKGEVDMDSTNGLDEDDLIENSIDEDNGEVDMDNTNGLDEDDLNENSIDEDKGEVDMDNTNGLDEDDLIENSIDEDNGELDMDSTNDLDKDDLNDNSKDEDKVEVEMKNTNEEPQNEETSTFSHISYSRNGGLTPVIELTRHDGEIVTCKFTEDWILWNANCTSDLNRQEQVALSIHFYRYDIRNPDDAHYTYDYEYEAPIPDGSQELELDDYDLNENLIDENNQEVVEDDNGDNDDAEVKFDDRQEMQPVYIENKARSAANDDFGQKGLIKEVITVEANENVSGNTTLTKQEDNIPPTDSEDKISHILHRRYCGNVDDMFSSFSRLMKCAFLERWKKEAENSSDN